ncbi:hypothetical protein KR222_005672 [Zaprionus bogoriensis]|nr:hypothetical protein KR222_005672 [Zaprionus bogoriensis]
MKCIQLSLLCVLLLQLLALLEAAPSGEFPSALRLIPTIIVCYIFTTGQIRIRTSSRQTVRVRNGNIRWNGDCHNCDIRTSKNTAQVTSTRNREIIRRF